MNDTERLNALLDALRTICDAIPDTADPNDLRWRNALRGLIAAFDPDPESLDAARRQRDIPTAVARRVWPHD